MNPKEMMVAIITAMVVMTMFASGAMAAINVNGVPDGTEWDGSDVRCVTDPSGDIWTPQTPYFVNGYDVTKFCVCYDWTTHTIYAKFEVAGTPGDTDGDGDPDGNDGSVNPGVTDDPGVGPMDTYKAKLDVDGDCIIDYILVYTDNAVTMEDASHTPVSGTGIGAISTIVEMSFTPTLNLAGFGDCYTTFEAQGRAGSEEEDLGEDPTDKFPVNQPPVPVPDGTDVCYCTDTDFDGSGSYDPDDSIILYEWDFDASNGIAVDDTGVTASHHYSGPGTYTVTLTVTDEFGFKCSDTTTVEVYAHPTASVSASPSVVEEPGGNVVFSGSISGGTPPYTYEWVKGASVIGSGTGQPTPVTVYVSEYTVVTLNVLDAHDCPATDYDSARTRPPQAVPILTLPGLLALIGMICIVGAGRILTKGRRS